MIDSQADRGFTVPAQIDSLNHIPAAQEHLISSVTVHTVKADSKTVCKVDQAFEKRLSLLKLLGAKEASKKKIAKKNRQKNVTVKRGIGDKEGEEEIQKEGEVKDKEEVVIKNKRGESKESKKKEILQ